jgi:ribosomal protein S18 acetylase RimI-like enzyme
VIVELTPALYDEAVALWREVGLTRPWNDPAEDLARAVTGPGSTVLAATDGVELRGTVMVGFDGHRAWMYYLAVRPSLQRTGCGAELVAAAEIWAADRGAPKVMLMVRADNAQVLAFYASLGYELNDVATLGKRLE